MGCSTGETVLLPWIPILPSDLPFKFKGNIFSIELVVRMTTIRAQRQILNVAEIDLIVQYLSWDQQYVLLSCVTSKLNVKMFALNLEKTRHYANKEIFKSLNYQILA